MKRFILFAIIALAAVSAFARFTVHSVSGSVSLERTGHKTPLAKGAEVGGVDNIVVGENSVVEIYNSADKRIYRCDQPGVFTTTRIMMNARKSADSKIGAIAKTSRFGTANAKNSGTVYEEGCLVTRALGVYDPEGATTQVDASTLAGVMAIKLAGAPFDSLPNPFSHNRLDESNGLEFNIENTFDFPVYVNVVKRKGETREVAISELGQPVGCYILLPGQSLMRKHTRPLDADEKHMLIMAHCYFDIDQVILKTAELGAAARAEDPVPSDIYVTEL